MNQKLSMKSSPGSPGTCSPFPNHGDVSNLVSWAVRHQVFFSIPFPPERISLRSGLSRPYSNGVVVQFP